MHVKKIISVFLAAAVISVAAVSANAAAVNYYQNWNNGKGSSSYTKGSAAGNISTTASKSSDGFNAVVGVGWSKGSSTKKIGYNLGSFNISGSTGCMYQSIYGWTTNSLIEYYVFQNWKNYVPTDWTKLSGTVSDGGLTYNLYKHQQVNQPSISGTQTFWQVGSIPTSQAGTAKNITVDLGKHISAWKNAGMSLGSNYDYVMMATEYYNCGGNSNFTVWDA